MKVWTAHEKPHTPPLLLREGFSFGAAFFGPIWLAMHRAWIPAACVLALLILTPMLTDPPMSAVILAGVWLMLGQTGRDLVRWSIERDGWLATAVIAARDLDDAQIRLYSARPDLGRQAILAETTTP